MSAPNPTSGDAAALAIDHSLNWMNLNFGDIVTLAELQANSGVTALIYIRIKATAQPRCTQGGRGVYCLSESCSAEALSCDLC